MTSLENVILCLRLLPSFLKMPSSGMAKKPENTWKKKKSELHTAAAFIIIYFRKYLEIFFITQSLHPTFRNEIVACSRSAIIICSGAENLMYGGENRSSPGQPRMKNKRLLLLHLIPVISGNIILFYEERIWLISDYYICSISSSFGLNVAIEESSGGHQIH